MGVGVLGGLLFGVYIFEHLILGNSQVCSCSRVSAGIVIPSTTVGKQGDIDGVPPEAWLIRIENSENPIPP